MKISLVTPWETGGGIANYSQRFKDALTASGVSVSIIPIPHPETSNPFRFNQIINEIDTSDVVHVQFEAGVFGRLGVRGVCAPPFFSSLKFKNMTIVTTLHEVHQTYPQHNHVTNSLLRFRDRAIERFILSTSDITIVHTQHAAKILQQHHGDEFRIEQLLHPVDQAKGVTPQVIARDRMGIEADNLLLTFGWVEQKKRYMDIIECLPYLPDTTYLIAGEPRYEGDKAFLGRILERASELGVRERVEHIGYIQNEELPTLFGATDVVVVPYDQVTQSGAVNTALAYHRPVVTTALPAFKELAEKWNCLETYRSRDELRDVLQNLLFNDSARAVLAEHAERYAESVTWEAFSEASIKLYQEMTSTN